MTVGELRAKINEAPGKSINISKEIVVSVAEDGDVDFKIGWELVAYVNNSKADGALVEETVSMVGHIKFIDHTIKVAQWLGLVVGEVKPVEVLKEIKVEDTQKFVLEGKVEAYEKILIGRGINVTK